MNSSIQTSSTVRAWSNLYQSYNMGKLALKKKEKEKNQQACELLQFCGSDLLSF